MTHRILGLAAAVLLVAPTLQAQELFRPARPGWRINGLQRREARFIRRGIWNDQLTRQEARRLVREQYRIRRQEARAKSDGRFTFNERRRLLGSLRRAGRHIYRDTHDRR